MDLRRSQVMGTPRDASTEQRAGEAPAQAGCGGDRAPSLDRPQPKRPTPALAIGGAPRALPHAQGLRRQRLHCRHGFPDPARPAVDSRRHRRRAAGGAGAAPPRSPDRRPAGARAAR